MSTDYWNPPTAAQFDAVASFVRSIPADQFDMNLCPLEDGKDCGCVLYHARQQQTPGSPVIEFAEKLQPGDKYKLFAFPIFANGDTYATPKGEAGKQEFLSNLEQLKKLYCKQEAGS